MKTLKDNKYKINYFDMDQLMQRPMVFAHSVVFFIGGLVCLAACCIGLFQFMTHDRAAIAHTYASTAGEYYQKSYTMQVSVQAKETLLQMAYDNIMLAFSSGESSPENWLMFSRILKAQGQQSLSEKAYNIAVRLNPAYGEQKISFIISPKQNNWQPLLVSNHLLDTATRKQ